MLAYVATKRGKLVEIICSDGQSITTNSWSDLVTYLLKPTDMGVVWNIDQFAEVVCSLGIPHGLDAFDDKGRFFLPDGTKLYYQSNRVFGVTYGRQEVNFYGLQKYSDTEITDAIELLFLGVKVLHAYRELGIDVRRLSSPVACFPLEDVPYPRACDLPDTAFDLLEATIPTMSREWRDVYKLGHWNADEVSDYDIHSAYPSIMAGLPDISRAKYFTATEIPKHFSWGEMTGKLKITKPISPFIHEPTESYPTGEWTDSITTDQLWLLRRWGIGEFQMEKGHFLILPEKTTLPFKQTMESLYQARDTENPIAARIAKAISVGIGGKLAQRFEKGKLGADFNSIYARMVTSRCMVKVADFIYRNCMEKSVVSVMVDGCLSEKRIELPNQKVMGTWRRNPDSPFLVASMLYQWGSDKHPDGRYYSEVVEDMRKRPRMSFYGDIDLNLMDSTRNFAKRPRTGKDLLENKYCSEPIAVV